MDCIYHSKDLDGWSSAAIINNKFSGVKLVGYDYGDPFPEVRKNVPLVVVDVSFPMEHMLKMAEERAFDLMWIDHHIKSIMEYEAFMKERQNTFCITFIKDGLASCELTWGAFHPDEPMPEAIRLLGMYDVHRNENQEEWENRVLPFQFGMRAICSSPEEIPALLLESGDASKRFIEDTIENGKAILTYMRKIDAVIMERKAFEAEFLGYRALCLNAATYSFLSFASRWDESKHDIAVGFSYNGKKWMGSIYTSKPEVDCNEIARKLGGGGHKRASGFAVDDIFEVIVVPDQVVDRDKEQERIDAIKAAVRDPKNFIMPKEDYKRMVERNSTKNPKSRAEDLDMDE